MSKINAAKFNIINIMVMDVIELSIVVVFHFGLFMQTKNATILLPLYDVVDVWTVDRVDYRSNEMKQ